MRSPASDWCSAGADALSHTQKPLPPACKQLPVTRATSFTAAARPSTTSSLKPSLLTLLPAQKGSILKPSIFVLLNEVSPTYTRFKVH